jgi:hypothetical protein
MANTDTWTLNGSGDWGNGSDWSTGIPNSGDDVVINTPNIYTITFSGGDSSVVNELTVGEDAFDITGGSLTVLTTASFAMGLTQSGGTLAGGAYTLNTTSVISGGAAEGSSTLTNMGTLNLDNYLIGGAATLNNDSTLDITGQITLGDSTGVGATIENAAGKTVDVAGDYGVSEGAASASISNSGTFEKGFGGGTSTIGVSFTNTGTLSAASGALALAGPVNTIGGTLTGAGEIAFSGGITNLSSSVIISAGSIGLLGSATVNLGAAKTITKLQDSAGYDATTTLNAGSYALTLAGASSFQGYTDSITGSGPVTNTGTMSLGGTLLLGGSVTFTNKGKIVDVGSLEFGDGSGLSPTIDNATGATINFASNVGIGFTGPAGNAITNNGTIEKTGGTGLSVIAMDLDNVGAATLAVASGALDLQGAVNSLAGGVSGAGALAFDGASVSTLLSTSSLTLSIATIDVWDEAQIDISAQQFGGAFNDSTNYGVSTDVDIASGADFQLTSTSVANFDAGGGGAQTVVNGAGQLTTAGSTTIGGNGFTLGGTDTWTNTGTVVEDSQVTLGQGTTAVALDNSGSTALYELNGNVGVGVNGPTLSTFTNSGEIEKTAGTGTSYLSVDVDNTGTIDSITGTIDLNGPVNEIGGTLEGASAIAFDGSSQSTFESGLAINVTTLDLYTGAALLLSNSFTYAGTLNDYPSYGVNTAIELGTASTILTLSGQDNFAGGGGSSQALVSGSGKLDTTHDTDVTGGGMTIGGTVAWTNSGDVTDAAQITIGDSSGAVATLTNIGSGAVFNLVNGGGIGHGASSSSAFTNNASLTKTGDNSLSTISADFKNTGTVTITDSTLDLDGPTNTLAGKVAGSTGTLILDSGSSTTLESNLSLIVGTVDLNNASVVLTSNLTFANTLEETPAYGADATINLQGHSLTLSGSVDLYASTGGSEDYFTGGGSVVTTGLTTTTNDGAQFAGKTAWTNEGTVMAAGQLVLSDSAGNVSTVTNTAAGKYDLTSNAGISLGGSLNASEFINNGTFEKTGGSGTSLIDALFVNNGTLTVTQGTIEIAAGLYSGSGAVNGAVTYDSNNNMYISASP